MQTKYLVFTLPLLALGLIAGQSHFHSVRVGCNSAANVARFHKTAVRKSLMPNAQIQKGTTGNVVLTGPNTSAGSRLWTITQASGQIIARGNSSNGSGNPSGGYNVSFTNSEAASGSVAAAVTVAPDAFVQTGLIVDASFFDGTEFTGTFDIVQAAPNQPQNFVLAFFFPSGGGQPNLAASWQQPAQGQPDSYNLYLGRQTGAEMPALSVPGSTLSHTFVAYSYGTVYGVITAVYGGAESTASTEAAASLAPPSLMLTATPQITGGIPAIVLNWTG